MIVNGVTLPDLPAEVLETYPYLTCITLPWEVTMLVASTQKAAFYDTAEVTGTYGISIFSYAGGTATVYGLESGATEWVVDEEPTTNGIAFWLHQVGLTDNSAFYPNHDICIATEYDNSAGKVTVGTEVWKAAVEYKFEEEAPTRVSIGRSLVNGYAREVQRLTGTTEQMNAVQIREKLSTVKAAIKIGDTVLPPIPEDVLAQYPYVFFQYVTMTSGEETMTVYSGLCSSSKFAVIPPGMIIYDETEYADEECYNSIWTKKEGVRISCFEGDADWEIEEIPTDEFGAWTVDHTSDLSSVGMGTMTAKIVWSNHDICVVTEMDYENGIASTVGTEVYFSERQNFNGVWLPKVPADVLAEYLYDVVSIVTNGDTQKYLLTGAVEKFIFDGDVVSSSGKGVIYYTAENDRIWKRYSYAPAGYMYLEKENIIAMVWSNHDIYEYDANGATTGDIWFPPLPAIDTDRVSMGYDLCDGIVEEVQRLSGDQDKMNALRAYWKLTTVV